MGEREEKEQETNGEETSEALAKRSQSLASAGVSIEDIDFCICVLNKLSAAEDKVDWKCQELRNLRKALAPHLSAFGVALPQKSDLTHKERLKQEKQRKHERRQRQLEADKRWQNNAQLRASRLAQLEALEGAVDPSCLEEAPKSLKDQNEHEARAAATPAVCSSNGLRVPDGPAKTKTKIEETGEAGEEDYERQQSCYICKARFSQRHHFYSHLCPSCSEFNYCKRIQACDMTGRVCLVTGGRVKIGFQTALKLLRMGARVIVTTRFPNDALTRFEAEPDFESFCERLQLRGADFRFLGAVERLCDDLLATEQWLDVVVNNACQTIRRPAGYYRHLLEGEAKARQAALQTGNVVDDDDDAHDCSASTSSTAPPPVASTLQINLEHKSCFVDHDSAAMSQLKVLAEDAMSAQQAAALLPSGVFDIHGQQLDLRSSNSWLLKLGEVSTPETVEVFCINALAPFILNSKLRPLLERSPHSDRYIVNVSAMEGKFYRYKQPTHPHTNMAKAALNMLTRTSAEDLARLSQIYMNSVDTGWINDENPLPMAKRIAEDHGFQTPIDEVDAAARVLDPVVLGMKTQEVYRVLEGEVFCIDFGLDICFRD
mmetsp:Transcript_72305/g.157738  ORF Transcript_72305/g.157738 Transcript_72305/m.157738 type:complete len:602 (+) Transcript_72305:252-2057(+)